MIYHDNQDNLRSKLKHVLFNHLGTLGNLRKSLRKFLIFAYCLLLVAYCSLPCSLPPAPCLFLTIFAS